MDTQVLWDGCNTDDNEIALLGNQAALKEELTDLADNAGVPELAVPELAVPQLPEPFVPINSFPFSHGMVTGEWPHPSVPIVSVAHGAHLTLRTIYQRAFQKLVNSLGEWTSTWAPLEARQAQTAHVFALSGYPAPCTKVWARLFAAWESYGLGTYSRAGSHGMLRAHTPTAIADSHVSRTHVLSPVGSPQGGEAEAATRGDVARGGDAGRCGSGRRGHR